MSTQQHLPQNETPAAASPARGRPTPGRTWLLILTVGLAGILGGLLGLHGGAWAIERQPLDRALLATVRVIVPIATEQDRYSTGSGTILSEKGLILTNYHVMGDLEQEKLYNSNGFAAIAINPTNLKSRPVLKYAAFLVASSPELDLALLRIGGLLEDANAPLPENLGLTVIPVGDSAAMQIGDEINAFGFPTIGGETVTFTSGIVSGFEDRDRDGYPEWMKVDLNINHGNSGGLATNGAGEFVGVPTQGRTDMGMIGLVRDGNMALEWVRRALVGNSPPQDGAAPNAPPNAPAVSNVQFAKAVNPQGVVINPAVRFPSGVEAIYATFDYANFANDAKFTFTWLRDGFQIYSDAVVWTLGKEGSTWVNVYDEKGLEDGYYELALTLDGVQLFRDGVMVGEQPAPGAGTFGAITFAKGVDDQGQPVDPGAAFSDVGEIYAFFSAQGVANGAKWGRRWYIDKELVAQKDDVWKRGDTESTWISLSAREGPLPVGRYRLELLLEDKVVQSGEMDIVAPEAKTPAAQEVIVVGSVTEADNKRQVIPGATVFFLKPGVSVRTFLEDPQQEQIYAQGVSNEEGFYQLDKKLTAGVAYSVVVYKKGRRLVTVDDFLIPPDAASPWEIDVTMERL